MWRLWRFRPRPLLQPWKWKMDYYKWRIETYSGIPASHVTWKTIIDLARDSRNRKSLSRYAKWLGTMKSRSF